MGGGGQNFTYESMGGGGGHKYDFHFLFWHQNALAALLISLIFSSFMPHFSPPPPKNADRKRYAYAEMPSVRVFCGNAHRHLIMRKYRQMHTDIWEIF